MKIKKINYGKFILDNLAWVIFIALCLIFSIFSRLFFTYDNAINILALNSYAIVAALGVSLLMMSGAMDLSIGYLMSCCGIVCAKLIAVYDVPFPIAIILTILLSMMLCILTTWLAHKIKLPLLIISLGAMTIYQGATFVISESNSYSGFSDAFKFIGQGKVVGFPIAIIIMIVLFLVVNFLLKKTYFGRYVFALGGNQEATRLAGINILKYRLIIALFEGFFVGLAAIMLIARMGTAQSTLGPGTEFTAITGILLGGVSIDGGAGKLSGVLAGLLIVAILSNGMQMAGFNIYYQYIFKGVIMLSAIGIDVMQKNRRKIAKLKK